MLLTKTYTADGAGSDTGVSPNAPNFAFIVKQLNQSDVDAEVVTWQLSGTFSGATATWQVCADVTASPQVWTDLTDGAYTAAAADILVLTAGMAARINISGSGSPVPSITLSARGQIQEI